MRLLFVIFFFILLKAPTALAQRTYAPHSVLATGNWYRIGVKQEGIYKVDLALLNSLGVNTTNLSSATIRLYGNGGGMLPESLNSSNSLNSCNSCACNSCYQDDLTENAIEMIDGGDGLFNGNDYFLFYAPGTQRWEKDSLQQRFSHSKNLYSDTAYYYLTIGGVGKRIQTTAVTATPTIMVNSFNERYFYENDLVNLLSSGKEWYGEEFSNNTGGALTRNFNVDWSGAIANAPVTLLSSFAGRSVGTGSNFKLSVNGQASQTVTIPAVSGYFLDHYATSGTQQSSFTGAAGSIAIGCNFQPGNADAQGWLNWIELHGRKTLTANGTAPFFFRDWNSVANNAVANFTITNTGSNNLAVWDITYALKPAKMNVSVNASSVSFVNTASRLREYVAFGNTGLLTPVILGKIDNQDLHNTQTVDYIIVSCPDFLQEAKRLALFHEQKDGLRTVVVPVNQVFHEFGSGSPDPAAIRDFVKMYIDRAGTDTTKRPRYLLLFGTASYDYRNRLKPNTNLVPCYESLNTLDPLSTYTSDDFFGLLNDGDDINLPGNNNALSISVGRIPARSVDEAKLMVDKIFRYYSKESLGSWRTETMYVADDKDNNLHLNDAEFLTAGAAAANPLLNQQKIYLDAYPLVSGSGGARYPAVNDEIVNGLYNGALVFNYSGHGSYQRLSEEAVVSADVVNRFNNPYKLPLFITASCDFAPYDDPQKNSLGAAVLTGSLNGAIALLTTTRLVFAYSNKIINDNFLRTAFAPDANGNYLSLGEAVRKAKNITVQGFGDVLNTRKFALLGDPAMRLAIPSLQSRLTSLNNKPLTGNDTLHALTEYRFAGMVTDAGGALVSDFNGTVYPVLFDKAQTVKTLGNDPSSPVTGFLQQTRVLYKGSATVKQGRFQFSFVVPKDISAQAGNGKMSLYAEDGMRDAAGVNNSLFITGNGNVVGDLTGPAIRLFLNDEQFLNGGLTNEDPVLLAQLADSSGINTSGNSIGHDITAVIDGNENNTLILNNFYTTEKDTYKRGSLRYQLPTLSPGKHRIRFKAWDVANNSGTATLDFVVVKKEKLRITNLRNFPNPFSGTTNFSFEHNQPGAAFSVGIGIYSATGQLVKRLNSLVQSPGSRNCQLSWDGTDERGRKLEKGVYIYRVNIAMGNERFEDARQLILF